MCVLGTKYARTPAQIGLRWAIQKGISVIPKSINPERIRSNGDIFDFNIEDEDMAIIDTLNEDLHTSHVPEDLRVFSSEETLQCNRSVNNKKGYLHRVKTMSYACQISFFCPSPHCLLLFATSQRIYLTWLNIYFHGSIGVSTFLSRSIRSITASAAGFFSKSTLFTSVMIGISTSYFSESSLAALAE